MSMDEEQLEQPKISKAERLKPWQFQKGQSGNPLGRPPGRSLKDRAKAYLAGLTDEEAVAFWEGLDKKVVWEMAEGKPEAKTDITSGGDKIVLMPPEVIMRIDGVTPETKGSNQLDEEI